MEPCPDTKVKILWDDNNLYLGFLLLEKSMTKQKLNQKHSSPGLCTDDSLEVLIDVGRQRNKKDYAHIMVSALGIPWHQWTRYGWCKPVPVDLGFQTKAWRGEDRLTAEIIIPLNSPLTNSNPPKPGDTWGLNMLRNRFTGTSRAFWSQPFTGSFHAVDRFGILHFVK